MHVLSQQSPGFTGPLRLLWPRTGLEQDVCHTLLALMLEEMTDLVTDDYHFAASYEPGRLLADGWCDVTLKVQRADRRGRPDATLHLEAALAPNDEPDQRLEALWRLSPEKLALKVFTPGLRVQVHRLPAAGWFESSFLPHDHLTIDASALGSQQVKKENP